MANTQKPNLLKKLWDAEPVVLALVLPALAALAVGAGLYANGATTGGGTTSGAGAVAAILGLLVRNKVFAPTTVEKIGAEASNLSSVLTEVQNARSEIQAVQASLPRRTGHEGIAAIAPWPAPNDEPMATATGLVTSSPVSGPLPTIPFDPSDLSSVDLTQPVTSPPAEDVPPAAASPAPASFPGPPGSVQPTEGNA